jgi:hypothetical protein
MKLRKVPNEVFSMMDLNAKFNYRWMPDTTFSLMGLGISYLLEFFEFYGDAISKYYDRFIKNTPYEDSRFHDFISQERRHAAAHKRLNMFMAKNHLPPTREKYHPRVYDFMYMTYKTFVEPNIQGIEADEKDGKTLDGDSFREALKTLAVFETEVCMAAFSFFDNLFDKGKIEHIASLSENLAVLYLLGYHYAEEMEHCHVSIETYEIIYGETLWNEKSIEQYSGNNDILSHRIINATLFVAREMGVEITVKQIISRLPDRKRSIRPGFNAKSAREKSKIDYLVNKWDLEWEPLLLSKIKQQLQERAA